MNRNKAIGELQEFVKRIMKFADESKFNNFTLTDGTQITIKGNDLSVGVEAYLLDDNQNQMPLDPDTEYVLQDGRCFKVDGNNKIVEVTEPEDSEDDTESGDSETDNIETSKKKMDADGLPAGHGENGTGDEIKPEAKGDSDLATRVGALEKQLEDIINFLQKLNDSQQEVNEQMMHKIKRMGSDSGVVERAEKKSPKGFQSYNSAEVEKYSKEETTDSILSLMRSRSKPKETEVENKKFNFQNYLGDLNKEIAKTSGKSIKNDAPANKSTDSLIELMRNKKN